MEILSMITDLLVIATNAVLIGVIVRRWKD